MPLQPDISERWERRLYRWVCWRTSGEAPTEILVERFIVDIADIDALMLKLRTSRQTRHIYEALVIWAEAKGTRGQQAKRLSIGTRTLYDRVEAGKALLEFMNKARRRKAA